jgi:hypothetical protein
MGELLAFHKDKTAPRRRRKPIFVDAEIILFPGVRYMRMTEPVKTPKRVSRRPGRRRVRPETEQAS